MSKSDLLKLWYGPYEPPRARRDGTLDCRWRGRVPVGDYSQARIPWPMKEGTRSLILCGDLVRAVRKESVVAVAHHWGVRWLTVRKWRQALGLRKPTPGTRRLIRQVKAENQGRISQGTSRSLLRPKASTDTRRKLSERTRGQIERSPMIPNMRLWTPEEEGLLGTLPDVEVARKLGRSVDSVQQRRLLNRLPAKLAKPPFEWTPRIVRLLGSRPDHEIASQMGCDRALVTLKRKALRIPPFTRRWTAEQIQMLGTRPDSEVARIVGRKTSAVSARRQGLGIPPFLEKRHWTAEEIRLLGTDTDEQIAQQLGRSPNAVLKRRQALHIPAVVRA